MFVVASGPNPMLTLNLKTQNKNQSRFNNTCKTQESMQDKTQSTILHTKKLIMGPHLDLSLKIGQELDPLILHGPRPRICPMDQTWPRIEFDES